MEEDIGNYNAVKVTPFTGVWIEIIEWKQCVKEAKVTPFTGVWIEIHYPKSHT